MNKEIQSLISRLENVHNGEPWFGRSVFEILAETDPEKSLIKPSNSSHSLVELLYHMITWMEFTLNRIERNTDYDLAHSEAQDWRTINPEIHTWKKGLAEFKALYQKIIAQLIEKDDTFLNEKVDYRKYDFRFLINGLIEHNIYHLGQIAYLQKLLA